MFVFLFPVSVVFGTVICFHVFRCPHGEMSSTASNLEVLTSCAEILLRIVAQEEEEDDTPETLSSTLDTFKMVAVSMTGADLELALLTARSIILKVNECKPVNNSKIGQLSLLLLHFSFSV